MARKSENVEGKKPLLAFTLDPNVAKWVRSKGGRNMSAFVNKVLINAMIREQDEAYQENQTKKCKSL